MAALLALGSAVFFGISDFSGGLAARRVPAMAVVLVSNGLALLLAVLTAMLIGGSQVSGRDLLWGAAAGTVGLLGVVLLYRGLAIGPMSIVAPLTAVLSAVVPVAVGMIRGERPGTVAIAGMVLAAPAMVLIGRDVRPASSEPGGGPGRDRITRGALLSALSAGLSFGGFYVLLAQTGPNGGAWPLVAQRAATVTLVVLLSGAALLRGRTVVPRGGVLGLSAVAGITDYLANLAYLQATHRGLLALVAVLSSLYPATTVLLARAVLHERLARPQQAGLALAAAAVALIAAR